MKIKLIETCDACPEQYDAFILGKQVGYLRLRSGVFTVHFPDYGGELVYRKVFEGDGWLGRFDTERQRAHYLAKAREAIWSKILSSIPAPDGTTSPVGNRTSRKRKRRRSVRSGSKIIGRLE